MRTLIVCLAWPPHFFFEPHKIFIPSTSETNLPTNENFFFYIKRLIFECGVNYCIIKESVEKNNGREFGIAKDVQKVCGVNKHISKVGEGVCQTR